MKNLTSLSISELELRNDYSINSSEAIRNILQKGGTISSTTNLIIGISLLVLGIIIYIANSNYSMVLGKINYMNCNGNNCVVYVQYQISHAVYVKEFLLDKNYKCPPDNMIPITYDNSNPNNCYIGQENYSTLRWTLLGFGALFILFWAGSTTELFDINNFIPEFSLYTKTETPSGLYVVSKK